MRAIFRSSDQSSSTCIYTIGLVVIGAVSALAWVGLMLASRGDGALAAVINDAGRQRMLSQRIALLALSDKLNGPEMKMAIARMEREAGSVAAAARASGNPHLIELYALPPSSLTARVDGYLRSIRALREGSEEITPRDLSEAAEALLPWLDGAVGALQAHAERAIETQRNAQTGLFFILIGLSLLQALFVFRPLLRSLSERSRTLADREARMQMVMDATGDGLLETDLYGRLGPIRSSNLERWLGPLPEDGAVGAYLFPEDELERLRVEAAIDELRDGLFDVELLTTLMVSARFARNGRAYSLRLAQSTRARDAGRALWIVRDVSDEEETSTRADQACDRASLLSHLVDAPEGFMAFLEESRIILDDLAELEPQATDRALGLVHTLKGNAASVGFSSLAERCHAIESTLAVVNDYPPDRVARDLSELWQRSVGPIERVISRKTQSKLLIEQRDLTDLVERIRGGETGPRLAAEVQSWREPRLEGRLDRLAAQAQRIAERLDKTVDIDTRHHGTRAPKRSLDRVWPALIHLVKNAIDHGIEPPSIRRAAGKPERGQLLIEGFSTGEDLVLVVEDDGQGIDWAALEQAARNRGIPVPDRDGLLRLAGLSSKTELTEVSGRGIGLTEMSSVCSALSGEMSVSSDRGQGTRFELRFPLARLCTPETSPRARA